MKFKCLFEFHLFHIRALTVFVYSIPTSALITVNVKTV
jgi:hypothetical protein